jgi:acetyl-CoA carboxylase / biotin carboxylase 1
VQFVRYLSKGQLAPAMLSLTEFKALLVLEGSSYALAIARTGPDSFRVTLNHSAVDAVVRRLRDGGLLVQADGASHVVHAEAEASGTRLTIDSLTCLLPNERDPSQLLAHCPGKLTRCAQLCIARVIARGRRGMLGTGFMPAGMYPGRLRTTSNQAERSCERRHLVADGAHVNSDQPYAEMESMKQIMLLIAPASGTIHFHVAVGCTVTTGQQVATLKLDDPGRVARTAPFAGQFPSTTEPVIMPHGVHHRFRAALEAAQVLLDGFVRAPEQVMTDLLRTLRDPRLPFSAWEEEWTSLRPLLPPALAAELAAIQQAQGSCHDAALPADALLQAIQRHVLSAPLAQQRALDSACAGAVSMLQDWRGGPHGFTAVVAGRLLDQFLSKEQPFLHADGIAAEAEAIDCLRREHSDDLQQVSAMQSAAVAAPMLQMQPGLLC